jgi:hypothetical protein
VGRTAVVLTASAQSVAVILPAEGDCILFDSHPRPGYPAAHAKFVPRAGLDAALEAVFPQLEDSGDLGWQLAPFNAVDAPPLAAETVAGRTQGSGMAGLRGAARVLKSMEPWGSLV